MIRPFLEFSRNSLVFIGFRGQPYRSTIHAYLTPPLALLFLLYTIFRLMLFVFLRP